MRLLLSFVFILATFPTAAQSTTDEVDQIFSYWRSEVAHRLRMAINVRNILDEKIKASYLADQTRMSKAMFTKYSAGAAAMNVDVGREIAVILDVPPQWLLAMDVLEQNIVRIDQNRDPRRHKEMSRILSMVRATSVNVVMPNFIQELGCSVLISSARTELLIPEIEKRGFVVSPK